MKTIALPALLIGLAAATLLVAHYGFAAVGNVFLSIGWVGFLAVVVLHLAVTAICGLAWFDLVPPPQRPRAWAFIWGRLVRGGGGDVLPLSQLGGLVLGARATSLAGLAGAMSVASTIVDITVELLSQLAFVALALAIFITLRPHSELWPSVAGGLAAAIAIAVLCVAVQRRGSPIVNRLAARLSRRWIVDAVAVKRALDDIYRRRRAVLVSFLLHFAAWIAGSVEVWIALQFMGRPLGIAAVLAIEGLLCAARAIAFAVPNALGVQEGAYVVLGGMFGLGPETALGLSLLKRARDLSFGIPALLVWQFVEGWRFWRRPAGDRRLRNGGWKGSLPPR
jgi:glycosyltransferase 2 family protein